MASFGVTEIGKAGLNFARGTGPATFCAPGAKPRNQTGPPWLIGHLVWNRFTLKVRLNERFKLEWQGPDLAALPNEF
jgi:hypothetical protein